MKTTVLFENGDHRWVVFGRDPEKIPAIIDTNQYMVQSGQDVILLDPGGIELFAPMLAAVAQETELATIRHLFASHQDPDIISSLGLWDEVLEECKLHAPWLWEGFIKHFGCEKIQYQAIPDEGRTLRLGRQDLDFVPAHYMHSSGNFGVYDPVARILMSGDVGAALVPDDAPMFVEDFDDHIQYMRGFHQRWLPSNRAKQVWIDRVRKLDIDMMAPQHGSIFQGDDVGRFLDWLEALEVGIAV